METSSFSCQAAHSQPSPVTEAKPKTELIKDPDRAPYPSDSDSPESAQMCVSLEQTGSVVCEQKQPDTPVNPHTPSQKESVTETPVYPPPNCNSPLPLIIGPEDPMAGMFALLTASEMAIQLRPGTPPASTLVPQIDSPVGADYSSAASLEMVALEGMALLSQMAQSDMKHISQEQGE